MPFLNREQIIAAEDRTFVDVDVPEWGGTVRLRSLDADQLLHQESVASKRQKGDLKVNPISHLLSVSLVDDAGRALFSEKDLGELGRKSPGVLMRLVKAVNDLNKFEDATAGNSKGIPDADSPSGSV